MKSRLIRAFDVVLIVLIAATAVRMWARHGERTGTGLEKVNAIEAPLLSRGSVLQLPGLAWWTTPLHVVALVDTGCKACADSVPFYQVLSARVAKQSEAQLVVAAAEDPLRVQEWLTRMNISAHKIVQIGDPASYGFSEIPTLLIVTDQGSVTDIVQRVLPQSVQDAFIRRLTHRTDEEGLQETFGAREIESRDFRPSRPSDVVQVLDVRDRQSYQKSHRTGSRNIPFDELQSRAEAELDLSRPVVVDCSRGRVDICRIAGARLKSHGFVDVAVVLPDN
jgi:rhodanese-related sulfurtransferase